MVAVWTAADVAGLKPIALREGPDEKLDPYLQPVLASKRVRYVGEPVAVVFAEDAYLAEDAAELVGVEVRELPPLLEAHAAPVEFEAGRSTEPLVIRKGYGDVDAAFRAAHALSSSILAIGRHSGVPLETRGAIARYDAARDILEMYGAAKVPHRTRDGIARCARTRSCDASICTKDTSAADSASAGRSIPRTCWCAWRAAARPARSNGSRIATST